MYFQRKTVHDLLPSINVTNLMQKCHVNLKTADREHHLANIRLPFINKKKENVYAIVLPMLEHDLPNGFREAPEQANDALPRSYINPENSPWITLLVKE
ncbi:hypothetical protein AVEN_156166-1 [Araneus ventricosus]|uniref:Uncharacterized protein n=1 Tax=Araneus ventricosus TaxID=182803 RepID=A0A4Y2QYZ6_ARAVE|nr:hypothetical protein AVEN_156166-1 [Araneus ventricosus]